jgi:hypothetical protein
MNARQMSLVMEKNTEKLYSVYTKQNLRSIIHGKHKTCIKSFTFFFGEETDFLPSRD